MADGASHPALLTFVVRAEPEEFYLHGHVTASAGNRWLASEPLGLQQVGTQHTQGVGTPVPLAQGDQLSSRNCLMCLRLCWSERGSTRLCPVTHVELVPSAWAPQRLAPSGGTSGTTAPLRDVPHKAGSHGPQATRGDLADPVEQNHAPTACPGPAEGWHVCPAGRHSGWTALCPPNRTAGLWGDSCKRAVWPLGFELWPPGPSGQSSSLLKALREPPTGNTKTRWKPPSLAAGSRQAWVGSIL